jgi:hypothetical protein
MSLRENIKREETLGAIRRYRESVTKREAPFLLSNDKEMITPVSTVILTSPDSELIQKLTYYFSKAGYKLAEDYNNNESRILVWSK